jgi:hypothetical protein
MTLADAVLEFLAEHRGETFCAGCLALKLRGAQATSSALFKVEGRGVRRVHDICSVCRRPRLVASLPPLDGGPEA